MWCCITIFILKIEIIGRPYLTNEKTNTVIKFWYGLVQVAYIDLRQRKLHMV